MDLALASTRTSDGLKQRADYTHKHNAALGRHGWLRLTPAYSLKIVDELLDGVAAPKSVFDPFCGTATTAICAASRGHDAITTELNPFLVWFGRAKAATYDSRSITDADKVAKALSQRAAAGRGPLSPTPPIHNVERWWNPFALTFLRRVKAGIDASSVSGPSRDLLLVAFCRTLIRLSNAAFNHQSMSFKATSDQPSMFTDDDGGDKYRADSFRNDVEHVLVSAGVNPIGRANVIQADARDLTGVSGKFDVVITSPPYPNRMSYIRELRPYMYWLGFLADQRSAGDLDWQAIGGTWGAATSRLATWTPKSTGDGPEYLRDLLARIESPDNSNGGLMSRYVEKYFEDMCAHLSALRAHLASGARLHYIVGNSTFYGVLVPVEQIYADLFQRLGFENVAIRAVRKRNSKKELVEFDVSAVWPH